MDPALHGGLDRRALLRRGALAAGSLALGPRLLRLSRAFDLGPIEPVVASAVPPPSIITRAEWGADETIGDHVRSFAPLVKAIVHHTAINEVDAAAQIREIQRYHVQNNGWEDIGYNFLVDREGRIYEGRWARDYLPGEVHNGEDVTGNLVIGAHAESHNPGIVGIAVLGDYSDPNAGVTAASLDAVARLIAWKFGRRDIDPHGSSPYQLSNGSTETFANICGHRDVAQNTTHTACPGDAMYAHLPEIRDRVAELQSEGLIGYRILGSDGSLHAYGVTSSFGTDVDVGDVRRNVRGGIPVRTAAGTATGNGVWVADTAGGVYCFGDAPFFGSLGGQRLNKPILGMSTTPSGRGYWMAASDGGVFCFGDARFFGSTGGIRLNQPVVGMAPTPSGDGYWLVASDGGVFCFGDARFFGSTGGIRLNQPVTGMAATPDGGGYWLVARDGGVFTFGTALFLGSPVGRPGFTAPATSITPTRSGGGYWVLDSVGAVHGFGDAPVFGGGIPTSAWSALALVPVVRS